VRWLERAASCRSPVEIRSISVLSLFGLTQTLAAFKHYWPDWAIE